MKRFFTEFTRRTVSLSTNSQPNQNQLLIKTIQEHYNRGDYRTALSIIDNARDSAQGCSKSLKAWRGKVGIAIIESEEKQRETVNHHN